MNTSVPPKARRFGLRASARSHSAWLLASLAGCLAQTGLHAATPVVGGGFTAAGLTAEYYPNTSFTGQPAFTRHDVRIRFDWRESPGFSGLPVGGALLPALKDFPTDNFSVRWTGQLRARYSETYTFHLTGEDGLRFRIRPAGTTTWSTLVDSLNASAVVDRTYAMTAGGLYDIEFSYVDVANTNASRAILEWSSPSTPREVVDPMAIGQIANTLGRAFDSGTRYADLVLGSKNWSNASFNGSDVAMDNNGWPTVAKCQIELANSGFYDGTYRFRFKGQAQVKLSITNAVFTVGNATYTGTLPKGVGYDGTYTSGFFSVNTTNNNLQLLIDQAQRNDGTPGITELQVMSPIAEGSSTPHEFGEIALREGRATFENFVMERHQSPGLGHQAEYEWTDRRPATYRKLTDPELQILQCNEQGHDLYFNFPVSWSYASMVKFAQTVRYGSDGVNPYDHYVANPVFPPLNPNLRVYTEHANELPWAVYPNWIWNELHDKAVANHPDWQIVNYDGKALNPSKPLGATTADGALTDLGMMRYHVLRMKQMSDALRQVYADVPNAFGEQFRPLCFGQYAQSRLNTMLQFMDDYFNNGDGQHVPPADARPPRYFLWGGGGAIYYGTENKFGRMAIEPFSEIGFQTPALAAGEARLRPTDSAWTFTGNAGIANVQLPRGSFTVTTPGATAPTPATTVWAGCKLVVGSQDVYVYQLGRMRHAGNTGSHDFEIFDVAGNKYTSVSSEPDDTIIDFSKGGTVGSFVYDWAKVVTAGGYGYVSTVTPIRLKAGQTYFFVSKEYPSTSANPNPDTFLDPTAVTSPAGLTVSAAVIGTDGKVWTETPGSYTYGPLNLSFTTASLSTAEGTIGVPTDLSANPQTEKKFNELFAPGSQCAFIVGNGSFKQTVTVPQAGHYWVTWIMARDQVQANLPVRVKVDGVVRSEQSPVYKTSWWYHATQVFELTAGTHEILFEGTAATGTVYIDEVRMGRDVDFFGDVNASNFPAGGGAYGQDPSTGYFRTAQAECDMSHHWGLVPCTYEGGWAVQGDFDSGGMTAWNDIRFGSPLIDAELTKRAQRNAVEVWTKYGGYVYAYFYKVQQKIADTSAPLVQGVREMNDVYMMNVDTGVTVPAVLNCTQPHYEGGAAAYRGPTYSTVNPDPNLVAREWKNWIITVPAAGNYRVTASGSGGQARLTADDDIVAEGSISSGLTGTVFLTQGAHAIKLRATDALTVNRIVVDLASSPALEIKGNGQLIGDGDTTPDSTDGTAFGVILKNTTLTRTFAVKNLGTQSLTPTVTLVGANAADFSIVTDLPAMIAGGAQANLAIRYSPTTVSSASATVRISYNGVAATQEFAISGSAENGPVANAGPDQTLTDQPGVVTLNGSASTGYGISPQWTQVSGPAVTLTGANTYAPTFPSTTAGTYVFQLAVNSPLGSATDTVVVRITAGDVPAQVFADHDRTVAPGTLVTLRGSASDIEGDAITYAWTQLSGPAATITGANTANASFTPSGPGVYVFQLAATSNGATSLDTVTITVASPVATLWWGGGTATPTASIDTNANATFNTAMAGTWNASTNNWNFATDTAAGYQAWNSANVAGFKSTFAASGGSPDVALAADLTAAGLRAEFPSAATNANYELISADANNRTLTLADDAQVNLLATGGNVAFNIRRAGYVSGRGAVLLGGSGAVTFNGLNSSGVASTNSTPTFNVESASLTGPVRLTSGVLNIGATSAGATGMTGAPLVEALSNVAFLRTSYAADTDNRLGDTAALVLANSQFSFTLASDTVAPTETVGSLTLEGSGMITAHLGRTGSTKTGTLALASGLTRGDNGHGVLIVSNTTTTGVNLGGFGVTTGNGFVLAGHGLGANAFVPWGFNYGRAQITTGGTSSLTSAGFLGTDATGKLGVLPATAGNADLASAAWQSFTATQDVALDNVTLSNALAGPVNVRSLAISLATTGNFTLGGNTLTTQALGFGDHTPTHNLTVTNGALTSTTGELYVIHRRYNTNAASNLTLNVPITGACDVTFGGANAQITLNSDNTHTGATYVNAAKVTLGSGGKFSASREINLAEGVTLVSTSADYTLGASTAQTLAGGGTWQLNQRTLNLGAQSTLAPGDLGANDTLTLSFTTGKLAFAPGSTVAFDLASPNASDAVAFATAGDWLAGSGNAVLALNLGAGFDYTKTYALFRNVTTDGFAFARITGHDTNRYVAYVGRTGNDITLSFAKVPNLTPVVATASLAPATAGASYSATLDADNTDYATTLTWAQTSGALPLGVTLSSTGVVSGTPAAGTQGSYTFTARVTDSDGDNSTKSLTLVVNGPAGSTALPSDRFDYVDDLGSGIVGDGVTLANGQFQIAANGLGLDGAAAGSDSALYAEKTVTGNFRATVKIAALTGPAASRAGLMLRAASASPDAGARFVALGTNTGNGYLTSNRATANAAASAETAVQVGGVTRTDAFAKWVRLQRTGDAITLSVSSDGVTFTAIDNGALTLAGLGSSVQIGLYASSGSLAQSADARFDSYEIKLQDPDLVLHYTFDEGAGTSIGDSATGGNNHTTTVTGAQWTNAGKYGNAYGTSVSSPGFPSFFPANQADLNFDPRGQAYTLSVWVKITGTTGYQTIFSKGGTTAASRQYHLWTGANNSSVVGVSGGTTASSLTLSPALDNGAWHLLTFVNFNDAGTWKTRVYYDNGTTYREFATGTSGTVAQQLRIGEVSTGYNRMLGFIDDLRIYKRALNATEVGQLYNGQLP